MDEQDSPRDTGGDDSVEGALQLRLASGPARGRGAAESEGEGEREHDPSHARNSMCFGPSKTKILVGCCCMV